MTINDLARYKARVENMPQYIVTTEMGVMIVRAVQPGMVVREVGNNDG